MKASSLNYLLQSYTQNIFSQYNCSFCVYSPLADVVDVIGTHCCSIMSASTLFQIALFLLHHHPSTHSPALHSSFPYFTRDIEVLRQKFCTYVVHAQNHTEKNALLNWRKSIMTQAKQGAGYKCKKGKKDEPIILDSF